MTRRQLLHLTFSTLVSSVAADACASPAPVLQLSLGSCNFSESGFSDVYSWGILLGVQNQTDLCAVPSTLVNNTMIMSKEVCDAKWLLQGTNAVQCRSRRGGYVIQSDLPDANNEIPSLSASNPGWVSIMSNDTNEAWQYAKRATLQLRDDDVTMLEGIVSEGEMHTSSHLGLGEASPLLQSLKDTNVIGARSWGLNSGSQSFLRPRPGSLVLGGQDEASILGDFPSYPVAKNNLLQQRTCPLQMPINSLSIVVNGPADSSTHEYTDPVSTLIACIEP